MVVLPELTDRNRHFWQGGERGELVFLRCQDCGYYLHPPIPVCPRDQSKDVRPEAVSGRATLASYTVNHHPWLPGFETPYVVAIVEMPEQIGLRLTTNLAPPAIWQSVATNVAGTNGSGTFIETNVAGNPSLFYRLALP